MKLSTYIKTPLLLSLFLFVLMLTFAAKVYAYEHTQFLADPSEYVYVASLDSDHDGIPNYKDRDDDNDGVDDEHDRDDDGDGYSDEEEIEAGSDPDDEDSIPPTDTTPPVVTAPADISVEATAILTPVSLGIATATDNFDPTVTVISDAPALFPVGTTIVTYTATDVAGNVGTATQTVTVIDSTAPVVTAPAAVTAEATGALTAVTLGTASATDVVDGVLTTTNDAPISGFPIGITTVTYSATDAAGNVGTITQTVTITDTTTPTITLTGAPAITVEAGTVYTDAGATASDLVDGDLSVSVIMTGTVDTATLGDYILTYSVSDAAGNAALAVTRTVTVVDTTAPVITAPAAVTAASGDNQPVTVVIGTATATDLFTVTITSDAPATFPVGKRVLCTFFW